ncbi:hypothetical protein [Gordonia westfalica]|uniref:Uncharacterized protein n=1 Tax=Gordonia westfalica TaxID=158898 RepID=A0A1H2L1D1_9ACTN|nr:hypothetical protein [Gordonia westfalica]SDU74740.1 hypothetical protein SAMN04488548_1344230 [Gordonia westfalica]
MNTSKIARRLTVGAATIAAAGALGTAGAPMAPAAPATAPPVQAQPVVGSVALCFGVPLGSLSFSICI